MNEEGDRRKAGRMTTISTIGGAASGTLLSGFFAQYLPDPLLLIYIVEFCLLTVALLLVANIQEAASPVSAFVGFHRPRVPSSIAFRFAAAGLSGGFVWSIAGLFLAIVPSYVSNLLHVRNLAAGGTLVAVMLGSSVAVQLVLSHLSTFRLQMLGMAGAVIGVIGVVMAWHLSSLVLMIAGSIICGAAIGTAYLGSITEINLLAKPEERGQVNSLYFVIVYLFFSIPTIGLGFAATHFGLYNAVSTFAGIITVLTIMETVWLAVRKRIDSSALKLTG